MLLSDTTRSKTKICPVLFDQCHVVEGRLRVNICDRIFLMGELEGHRLTVQGGF